MSEKNCYFASANSKSGFVGFFEEIFSPCKYRYIIKGGPGTGKSTLMRRLGKKAEEMGYETEYFLCSSDPTSLDGVIVKGLDIAVIDGTAPHMCDPTLPGVNSEIVNLGVYWNKKKLIPHAEEIGDLSTRQSDLYKKAYAYISAIYKTKEVTRNFAREAIDREKAEAFARRFARKFQPETIGDVTVRLCDSMGMKGYYKSSGFTAETNYVIKPYHMAEYDIMSMIFEALKDRHIKMIISYSHIDAETVNAILLPEHGTSITIADESKDNDLRINIERFIDKEKLHAVKNKLRFSEKCEKELMSAACDIFNEIDTVHFKIEDLYKNAMNFTRLTKDSEKIIDKILGV